MRRKLIGSLILATAIVGSAAWSQPIAQTDATTTRRRAVRHPSTERPAVYVSIFTHNEDPHHKETPDFSRDRTSYESFRAALLEFAALLRSKNIDWNWQSDWNFLNAVIQYEITAPDAGLLAATNNKNIVRYLKEDLGVEIDPHSHENDGYNYADVAYLVQQCGVTPSPVVGGHIYEPTSANFQNWPRFDNGINGSRYPSYFWKPSLLMGAGTTNHARDPVATGLWRPKKPAEFFATGGSGIAAFGNWDNDNTKLGDLISLVESGQLSASSMWTAAYGFNQSDMVKPGFIQNTIAPAIDRLVAYRDSGRIRFVRFEESLQISRNTFGSAQSVYQRTSTAPFANNVTFSLNVQDFAYPAESAALVSRVLDLHERLQIPIDVFLTTSQVDIFASDDPALLTRLVQSPVVALSYHLRAPKPYASNYDWIGLRARPLEEQISIIANYETHGLDLVTGQPTKASGGVAKLATIAGHAPFIGGGLIDPVLGTALCSVFSDMGVRLAVQHGRAVNLGETYRGLALKPEHIDLKLFEHLGRDGATVLDEAIDSAPSQPGAVAPYFVGVKMHDNDFFATQSAWTEVYLDGGKRPPWDPTRRAPLLGETEQAAMWTLYEEAVNRAAARRDSIGLVNARDISNMVP